MIYVGIGSNLSSKGCSTPYQTVLSAIKHFPKFGLKVCKQSDWYESEPVPVSSQPWFINGVVEISSTKGAASILKTLHSIEDLFGRIRGELNAARTLDLDLLDYKGMVVKDNPNLILPHPRINERAFVILPLQDICPEWRSPITTQKLSELVELLPEGQKIKKINY